MAQCRQIPVQLLQIAPAFTAPARLAPQPCQRRLTLNKSTSITPWLLLHSSRQEGGLHVGQYWMQINKPWPRLRGDHAEDPEETAVLYFQNSSNISI